ncbi:pleckstrin homology domain-containing family G member 4B [Grus americana]|uniref:pleckstrin homology domain-containing family G member 4B n=1 Tax=Grus americana TaxID=9117 RepID=UPI0024082695|nr:pleckstrin homology domain-containing family G member 4B [Grus americana]
MELLTTLFQDMVNACYKNKFRGFDPWSHSLLFGFCSWRGLFGPGLAELPVQLGSERRDFLPDGGHAGDLELGPGSGGKSRSKEGLSGARPRSGQLSASLWGSSCHLLLLRAGWGRPPAVWRDRSESLFAAGGCAESFASSLWSPNTATCCGNSLSPTSHRLVSLEEQIGMYTLYSKNKLLLDAFLISHRNDIFKNKYALLLEDMITECTKAQEQELSDLTATEAMVKFQLHLEMICLLWMIFKDEIVKILSINSNVCL